MTQRHDWLPGNWMPTEAAEEPTQVDIVLPCLILLILDPDHQNGFPLRAMNNHRRGWH